MNIKTAVGTDRDVGNIYVHTTRSLVRTSGFSTYCYTVDQYDFTKTVLTSEYSYSEEDAVRVHFERAIKARDFFGLGK